MQWPRPGLEGNTPISMEPTQAIMEGAYGKFGNELPGLLVQLRQGAIFGWAYVLPLGEVFGQAIFPGGHADTGLHDLALVNQAG